MVQNKPLQNLVTQTNNFISPVSAVWAGLSWAGLLLHLALARVRSWVTAEVGARLGWKVQEGFTNWGLHVASL